MAVLPLQAVAKEAVKDHPRVSEALELVRVWLEAQRDYQGIPGLSVALVYDQQVLWSGGFGYADRGREIPAGPDSIYGICSISKLFTSIAVMQQRDVGHLRLDDPVAKHLDWFGVEQAYEGSAAITIEGLLTHSSGLPREPDTPYWAAPDYPFPTREEVMALQAGQKTLYPAATYYQYSNLGMILAGEIAARAAGQPYGDYVRDNILKPLGMKSTFTRLPEERLGTTMAVGYGARERDGGRSEVPIYQAKGVQPAAGLASTAGDLARFASWQFRLLGGGKTEVLAANTLKEMQRPHFMLPDWKSAWGLGFGIYRPRDTIYVGHGGDCPGFNTRVLLDPKRSVGVVLLANANDVNVLGMAIKVQEVLGPVIEAAVSAGDNGQRAPAQDFSDYTGIYSNLPWGVDSAILEWKGGLAHLYLSNGDPLGSLDILVHVEGDVFRRKLEDGELGEEWVFERDSAGRVVRMRAHSHPVPKVNP